MRIAAPIRYLFAALVLVCLAALFVTPSAIGTVVVHSHTNGKQFVRVIGFLTIIFLAAGVIQGMLYVPGCPPALFRQVYVHGFGPDLLDKTCARLC